ncbi:hypothetical protein DEU56DRAFT_906172 [Suillus clintonianus]|uniref:uncharacterized protein n=1 Tax=Suillus clintonianus TaxID=1904413 RepID=UPI001B86D247|nr:uncharacterized protein DEU56DRAFT_906172 [Suillus clintonianus]KAG2157539.1 hypothetical protein DEU56DRAFT_906172 [Suillus clintonianus]
MAGKTRKASASLAASGSPVEPLDISPTSSGLSSPSPSQADIEAALASSSLTVPSQSAIPAIVVTAPPSPAVGDRRPRIPTSPPSILSAPTPAPKCLKSGRPAASKMGKSPSPSPSSPPIITGGSASQVAFCTTSPKSYAQAAASSSPPIPVRPRRLYSEDELAAVSARAAEAAVAKFTHSLNMAPGISLGPAFAFPQNDSSGSFSLAPSRSSRPMHLHRAPVRGTLLDPGAIKHHQKHIDIMQNGWPSYFPLYELCCSWSDTSKVSESESRARERSLSFMDFCEASQNLISLITSHLASPDRALIAHSWKAHYDIIFACHDIYSAFENYLVYDETLWVAFPKRSQDFDPGEFQSHIWQSILDNCRNDEMTEYKSLLGHLKITAAAAAAVPSSKPSAPAPSSKAPPPSSILFLLQRCLHPHSRLHLHYLVLSPPQESPLLVLRRLPPPQRLHLR